MQGGLFQKKIHHNKIHQIYYDWGRGISELFEKSINSFKNLENCEYRLWSEEECEDLLRDYPEFRKLYYSCKYKIMKIDIIRFIILYEHGGLYADLDVIPVVKELPSYEFAVSKNDQRLNIEVLLSTKSNKVLLDFLEYVEKQIVLKNEIDIYKNWKLRYVFQTTGPRSFARFLKGKEFNILKLNEPDHQAKKDPQLNLKGDEDFISYPSCSFKESM